jgi:predicted transcriptional regulator
MRRSKDIIISEILEICSKGATKTRIVYQVNLNFRTVNPYIELLTKAGMIYVNKEQNKIIYMTTGKGNELLENFRIIQESLPDMWNGPQVNEANVGPVDIASVSTEGRSFST